MRELNLSNVVETMIAKDVSSTQFDAKERSRSLVEVTGRGHWSRSSDDDTVPEHNAKINVFCKTGKISDLYMLTCKGSLK